MRHGKSGRKLNRSSSHRLAMFRNMVTSLLDHERIYTTHAKAKELRRWADWMITLGKRGDLHARRQALQVIRDKSVVHKLFTDLAQRYQARSGGYTRTVKVGFRVGDGAPLSLIELMTGETVKKKKKRKPRKAVEAAPPAVEEAVVEEAVAEEAVAEEAVDKKKKKSKAAKKVEAEAPATAEAVAEEAVDKKKKKSKAAKKVEAEAPAAEEVVEEKTAADEVSEPEPEKAAKPPKKKKAKTKKDKEGDEK